MSEEAAAAATSSSQSSSTTTSNGGLSSFLIRRLSSSMLTPRLSKFLSPMYNNIASAIITIIYVKVVMEIGAFLRVKYGIPEVSRKFVHFCACSIVVFWPLFDPSHWGWRLNVTVPVVMSLRLLYKGAILKDPEDEDVRSMSRTSSPSELLYGPLQMTLIMCYVGLTKYMTPVGVIIMASLVGDGMAAAVGIQYGKHKLNLPWVGVKSIEGTIGCVVGTMGGMWFFSYMCGIDLVGWRTLLVYGCISALVEATALRNWDNLILAVVMEISAKHVPNYIAR